MIQIAIISHVLKMYRKAHDLFFISKDVLSNVNANFCQFDKQII